MPLTDKTLRDALRLLSKTYVGRHDEQDLLDVIAAIEAELHKRHNDRRPRQQHRRPHQ